MIKEFIRTNRDIIVKIFLIIMWVMFCGYFVLSFIKPLYQDEGVFLTIGRGIAEGKTPYLDFWDHKTPGIHLLWALLFPLFGTKLLAYKLFIWAVNFATGYFVYDISEKIKKGSGKFSFIFFICSLVFLEGNYLIAGQFLGLFLIISTWLLIVKGQKVLSYFGSGLALLLAIMFKQTAILNILPLLIFVIATLNIKKIFSFLVGFFAPLFITTQYLKNIGAYTELIKQAFESSTKNYPPEPINEVLAIWKETFLRFWWLWFGFILSFLQKIRPIRDRLLILAMAFFPIIGFYVRHYPHYWLQVLPFFAVLAGLGFFWLVNKLFDMKINALVVVLFASILLSFWGNLLWFKWVTGNKNRNKEIEQVQVVERLKSLPDGPILAENRFTGFNFLSGRETLTRFLYLTEVNEAEEARARTISALQTEDVLVAVWPIDQEYVYAKEIGDWLIQNTEKVAEYPALDLAIYLKKN